MCSPRTGAAALVPGPSCSKTNPALTYEGGGDAAAPAYESLLALTYDAIKAADSTVTVLGGAVSPRGADKPDGLRPTHSPTVFIHDMGQAYRDSGRTAVRARLA